jgi:hypothetical protein
MRAHRPSETTRAKVIALCTNGARQDRIAEHLEIDAKTLRKHYGRELEFGTENLLSRVLNNLASIAHGRGLPAVSAAKYLLSCRGGYKEHSSLPGFSATGPGVHHRPSENFGSRAAVDRKRRSLCLAFRKTLRDAWLTPSPRACCADPWQVFRARLALWQRRAPDAVQGPSLLRAVFAADPSSSRVADSETGRAAVWCQSWFHFRNVAAPRPLTKSMRS